MYRLPIAIGAMSALTAAVIVRPDLVQSILPAGGPSTSVTDAVGMAPMRDAGLSGDFAGERKDGDRLAPSFDVVRVDPEGATVFAGRAPPNSTVTILANGQAVATARADGTGAWAAVTQHKFAPAEYEFTLNTKPAEGGDVAGEQRVRVAVAPREHIDTPRPMRQTTALQVKPPPITFVYNETTFTEDGSRAADLLTSHLIAQRLGLVSLSGHADERGSDEYNMELSRQRLQVVASFLRDHGYNGPLILIPKGKREPYTGVDRRTLSPEDAFRLDRRVELRQAR